MGLFRILMLALAAILIYGVARKLTGRGGGSRENPEMDDERLGRLVQCHQCEVYVDSKEAYKIARQDDGLNFCSKTCAKKHQDHGSQEI